MAAPVLLRPVSSSELTIIVSWITEINWNIPKQDIEMFLKLQGVSFIAAEKDGEIVGCVLASNIGTDLGIMAILFVRPDQRGKGIGGQLIDAASRFFGSRNWFLNAVMAMVPTYIKYGYKIPSLYLSIYRGMPNMDNIKQTLPATSVSLVPCHDVPFDKLLDYDTKIHIIPRAEYLKLCLELPNVISMAAMEGDQMVGYGILKPAITGFRIAPLYANSYEIAKHLFVKLLGSRGGMMEQNVIINALEVNEHMTYLAHEMGLTAGRGQRLYSQKEIQLPVYQVYSLADLDVSIV